MLIGEKVCRSYGSLLSCELAVGCMVVVDVVMLSTSNVISAAVDISSTVVHQSITDSICAERNIGISEFDGVLTYGTTQIIMLFIVVKVFLNWIINIPIMI